MQLGRARPPYRAGERARRRIIASAALSVSLIALTAPAFAAPEILDIRTGRHPDRTRLVLDVSEPASSEYRFVEGTGEFVIDLPGTGPGSAAELRERLNRQIGVIDAIDVTPVVNGAPTRVIVRFRQPAGLARVFRLPPRDGRPYRLVFDFEPVRPSELARELARERAETRPAPEPAPATDALDVQRLDDDRLAAGAAATDPAPEKPADQPPAPPPGDREPVGLAVPITERTRKREATRIEWDISGYIEAEGRYFPQDSVPPGLDQWVGSVAAEPTLDVFVGANSTFTLTLFGRVDSNDDERTHFDIREMKWVGAWGPWELRLGVDKVFWGVTESVHVVDIINQDDAIEDVDAEDKLGQPLASVSYSSDVGLFTLFAMPYFRERTFPGPDGRPSPPIPIDDSQAQFESGTNNWHFDVAARWSHAAGPFDWAVSYFHGVNRDPRMVPGLDGGGNPVMIPRYDIIDQVGFEAQATIDSILLKNETIWRDGELGDFFAGAVGFEYTLFGIGGGDSDLGILAEYLYDSRDGAADQPFQNDLFAGLRWTGNDVQSTEVLVGAIFDLESSAKAINVEAARRFGENWRVSIDGRFFASVPAADPLAMFADDDFIQLRIARWF